MAFMWLSHASAADPSIVFDLEISKPPTTVTKDHTVILDAARGLRAELHNVDWIAGPFGDALRFNGKMIDDGGSAVLLPDTRDDPWLSTLGGGPFTVECWFKLNAAADDRGTYDLINAGNAYGPGWRLYYTWRSLVFVSGNGEKEIDGKPGYWGVGTDSLEFPVPLDTWHHVAVVRDSEKILTLYLDGVLAARSNGAFEVTPSNMLMTIGSGAGGTIHPFNGDLAAARIYDGALSAEQILLASQGIAQRSQIKVDGKMDELLWKNAKQYGDFRLHHGGQPAEVQTRVHVTNDADNLYFGIVADEPNMDKLVDVVREHSMQVYHDDSLEIMIAADGNQSDFYHFLINPSGFRAQEMRVQGGNVGDRWENRAWFAGTSKQEGQWVAEFAIPLAILNREQHATTQTIRFNVERNLRTAPSQIGRIESSLAAGTVTAAAQFLEYRLDNVDISSHQLRTGVVKLSNARLSDGLLDATVTVPLRNLGQRAVDLDLLAVMMSVEDQAVARLSTNVPTETETSVDVPFTLKKPGNYTFFLFGRDRDSLVLVDQREIEVAFVPVMIDVVKPFYRNNIYATETVSVLSMVVHLGLSEQAVSDSSLRLSLLDASGNVKIERKIDAPPLQCSVELPVSYLAIGAYQLRATLTRGDQTLAEATEPIRKLPKPDSGHEVRVDERLRLIIDGQARLPISWWTNDLVGIVESGADAVLCEADVNESLDELQAVGLMAVVSVFDSEEADRFIRGQNKMSTEAREYLTEKINRIKNHPALLCWFLKDELEVTGDSPQLHREFYELLCELDPYHPVAITNDSVRGLHTYAPSQDVFLPDPYVLPVKGGGLERGMDFIVLFMQEALKAGDGRKLIGHTPQVFNYGDLGQYNGRAPSFVEQRCQQYLSIIHGTRFFSYYKFTFMKGYPELEYGMPKLIKEIQAITPMVLHGMPMTGVNSSDPAIHLLPLIHDGKPFILACNVEPKSVSATISIPESVSRMQVLSEGRVVDRKGAGFTDLFEPYATHIYSADLALSSPISLSEVQQTIIGMGGTFSVKYEQP
jgi:hypothetical protein